MGWLDARQAAGLKVFSQSFVAKRCNHADMITCCVVRNKRVLRQRVVFARLQDNVIRSE